MAIGAGRGGSWSPQRLFAKGELGAWWDNQDLATLFSDAARTTPAEVDGEVLGQTDKSGNNLHRSATAGNGPILRQRADGVYYLDYAGGKTFAVSSSTQAFEYLHDGTGGTIVAFVEWLQGTTASNYLQSTGSTSASGIQIIKSAATEGVTFSVSRSESGVIAGSVQLQRIALSSAPRMMRFSYKNDGGSGDFKGSVDSSLDVTEASTSNAPAAGASGISMQVSSTFGSMEYGAIIRKGVLDESEVATLWRYFRRLDYPVPNADLTILLGGQSNMSGRGTVVTTAAEEKQIGVYSYTKAEEFRIATVPEHSIDNRPVGTDPDEPSASAPQHGFALRAGKALKTGAGTDVLLVPCAVGSTSFAQWDTPESVGDRTTLFGAMVYRYQRAIAKGGSPVIVWSGHEGNAELASPDYTNGGVGSAYQAAFASLIASIRAHTADAPLIFVQLASDDTEETAEKHAAAGEAQRQCEMDIERAFMVVAHDVQRNVSPDDIHVSREGMDVIGDRVALAIRDHILSGLGRERAANGGFTADKAWAKGSGWSISAGAATRANIGTWSQMSQPMALTAGRSYRIEYTLSDNSGSFQCGFSGGANRPGTIRTAPGTYSETLVAVDGNNTFYLGGGSSFAGSVSDVSVREITNENGTLEPINGTGPRIIGATYSDAVVTLECDKAINESAGNYGDLFRVYDGGEEATVIGAVRNADASKIDITCAGSLSGPVTLTYGYRAGAASAARTDFVADDDGLPLPVFGPVVASAP